jgi:hypothetical protein
MYVSDLYVESMQARADGNMLSGCRARCHRVLVKMLISGSVLKELINTKGITFAANFSYIKHTD